MKCLTTLVVDKISVTSIPFAVTRSKRIGCICLRGFDEFSCGVVPLVIQSWMSPTNNILFHVRTPAGTSSLDLLDEQNGSFYGLPSILEDLQNLQRLWLKYDSEAQLNQIVASILDNLYATDYEKLEAIQSIQQNSNIVTSASIDCHSQIQISNSKNSLTSLLIQIGMNCHATNILRENILQVFGRLCFALPSRVRAAFLVLFGWCWGLVVLLLFWKTKFKDMASESPQQFSNPESSDEISLDDVRQDFKLWS